MIPGLVSISFRASQPQEIVSAAAAAGLRTLEWGGDVHVPHDRPDVAREVAQRTRDAALGVAAYGSYYYAGWSPNNGLAFAPVLETAIALGAPCIRVWAGRVASADASAVERAAIVADLRRCAEACAPAGVRLATEFHVGTLTDTAESAHALLREIDHPQLRTYWQPPHGMPTAEAAAGLRLLAPWVENVHVFHWGTGPEQRFPLSEGVTRWRTFLREVPEKDIPRAALLEFMPHNDLAELPAEAAALLAILDRDSDRSNAGAT